MSETILPSMTANMVPPAGSGARGATRARVLYVIRESALHDRVLFDAMRERTYAAHMSDPAVAAIIEVGLRPLDGTSSFTVERTTPDGVVVSDVVYVETLRWGSTMAILFEYAGTWHLWSMSSAAKVDGAGTNEFTEIIGTVIQRLRPSLMVAANFSRLIRSQKQGARLQTYMQGNVDFVQAGSVKFELSGKNEQIGWMMFAMFALIASMERDWITARLQAGRVAAWKRGQWTLGSTLVPFGYRWDGESQTLVPILELRTQVEVMLRILGSQLPPRAMLDALGAAGVTFVHARKGRKPRSIAKAKNARLKIDALYASMPIWLDGEYLLRLANTSADVTNVSGAPVVRDGEDDLFGEFQMLHNVAVPAGGWAPPEVLAAARSEALRRGRLRGDAKTRPLAQEVREMAKGCDLLEMAASAHRIASKDKFATVALGPVSGRRASALLSGHTWADGEYLYQLRTASDSAYALMRGMARPGAEMINVGEAK